ncbi:MAG TPA: hypothetical protein V6D03_07585, partial [Candidatus Caenarcaniphilales bacterium]
MRALLAGLEQAGKLAAFETTVALQPSNWYIRLMPQALKTELLRRAYDLPQSKVNTRFLRELVRLTAPRLRAGFLTAHETGWASIDSVYRDLDHYVAKRLIAAWQNFPICAVYGYEDGALNTFRAAKQVGVKCFYELPIGYWRVGQRIQEEEAYLNPEWAPTLTAQFDSEAKLADKDEELQLADAIFVASRFTQQTLQAAPPVSAPVLVIPYGAPFPSLRYKAKHLGKLRVLFVGSLGQRKGICYLLEAIQKLGAQVELTLIG